LLELDFYFQVFFSSASRRSLRHHIKGNHAAASCYVVYLEGAGGRKSLPKA
jgi:hypothetical protein